MEVKNFRPRPSFRPGAIRLIFFADGVRIPKRFAVRLVVLHLVLTHSPEWDYAAAERRLERAVNARGKRMRDIDGIETQSGLIWAEEQCPKPRKRDKR